MRTETLPREFALAGGRRVALRPVTPEDEEFLLGVYASTREGELSQVEWGEGQRDAFLRQRVGSQAVLRVRVRSRRRRL